MSAAAIRCERLRLEAGGRPALHGLDLEVAGGETYGLLGPDREAGTALLRTLAGLARPLSGECRILGLDPGEKGLSVRRRIGYVPREAGVPSWMNAVEAGELLEGLHPSWDPGLYEDVLAELGVPPLRAAERLSPLETASLALALGLGHRPHALLLDEPLRAAVPEERAALLAPVLGAARQSGMAVLLTSDLPRMLEPLLDRAGVVAGGLLVEEAATGELIERYRRVRLHYVGEPVPEAIRVDGVLQVVLEPSALVLVLEGWSEEMRASLLSLEPSDMEVTLLGLEEVVAISTGRGVPVEAAR